MERLRGKGKGGEGGREGGREGGEGRGGEGRGGEGRGRGGEGRGRGGEGRGGEGRGGEGEGGEGRGGEGKGRGGEGRGGGGEGRGGAGEGRGGEGRGGEGRGGRGGEGREGKGRDVCTQSKPGQAGSRCTERGLWNRGQDLKRPERWHAGAQGSPLGAGAHAPGHPQPRPSVGAGNDSRVLTTASLADARGQRRAPAEPWPPCSAAWRCLWSSPAASPPPPAPPGRWQGQASPGARQVGVHRGRHVGSQELQRAHGHGAHRCSRGSFSQLPRPAAAAAPASSGPGRQ